MSHNHILASFFSSFNSSFTSSIPELTDGLTGVMYADKGYIKQNLFVSLYERGLKMVHGIKKNMPNKLMDLKEKIMLRKRKGMFV
ncbi:transposase [Candidatus Tisiphia endosymbiont of Dioctria rufipes]|uniref:transposase n=1 Tax=Candidatus Tisiphia endosymbiont of Dioctria rufipes TaxID=3066255 RepID=UPI00312C7476